MAEESRKRLIQFEPGRRVGGVVPSQSPKGSQQPEATPQPPKKAAARTSLSSIPVSRIQVQVRTVQQVRLPPPLALVEALVRPLNDEIERPAATAGEKLHPRIVERMREWIIALVKGEMLWWEVLGLEAMELVEMALAASSYLPQGRMKEAAGMMAALCELQPAIGTFWLAYGDLLEAIGCIPEALDSYSSCIDVSEGQELQKLDLLFARYQRAALYIRERSYREAALDLKKVLINGPKGKSELALQAAITLQALLNDGQIPTDLIEEGNLGNGWVLESGRLNYVGQSDQTGPGSAVGVGSRYVASAQIRHSITYSTSQYRTGPNTFRRTSTGANLARAYWQRTIQEFQRRGKLPLETSSSAPERQEQLGTLRRYAYETVLAQYHAIRRALASEADLDELEQRAAHLWQELQSFYRQRAQMTQLSRSYRTSQVIEVRASRFRGRL